MNALTPELARAWVQEAGSVDKASKLAAAQTGVGRDTFRAYCKSRGIGRTYAPTVATPDRVALATKNAVKRLRAKVRVEVAIRADEILAQLTNEIIAEVSQRAAEGLPFEVTERSIDEAVRAAFR